MSYAPGTKLTYKAGKADREGDSSVVVLRNGGVLEIRRGNNTFNGAAHRDRRQWASVDEWRTILPADATVQTLSVSTTQTSEEDQHPDIRRITNKFREAHMRVAPNIYETLFGDTTRAEKIAMYENCIVEEQQHIASEPNPKYHHWNLKYIAELQGCIDSIKKDTTPETVRYSLETCRYKNVVLYGQAEDGSLKGVYINRRYGKFAVRVPEGEPRIVDSLDELGFPHYFIRLEDRIVPF